MTHAPRPGEFAHDMKNQLGIIIGFVELLIEETGASDPRLDSLLEIRIAAQACLKLVDREAATDSTDRR